MNTNSSSGHILQNSNAKSQGGLELSIPLIRDTIPFCPYKNLGGRNTSAVVTVPLNNMRNLRHAENTEAILIRALERNGIKTS